nr:GNAT family N-acetyltransferase [Thioalkalivibrio sp. ALE12]
MVRNNLKIILHATFGEYQYWKVYAVDLPYPRPSVPSNVEVRVLNREDLEGISEDGLCAENYLGEEALGYGLFLKGRLAAVQAVWWGSRYMRERAGRSWRLSPGAAKTTSLYVLEEYRKMGYATLLKKYVLAELSGRGFRRVYARIWHSHRNSIRVSRKVGMRLVGVYVELCPQGKRLEFRIPLNPK